MTLNDAITAVGTPPTPSLYPPRDVLSAEARFHSGRISTHHIVGSKTMTEVNATHLLHVCLSAVKNITAKLSTLRFTRERCALL